MKTQSKPLLQPPSGRIAVITDSCADIPPELVRRQGIYILPLQIRTAAGAFRDGVDIHPADIYRIQKSELPKTSLPLAPTWRRCWAVLSPTGIKKRSR